MAQSIKLGSDTYLDWSAITTNNSGRKLSDLASGQVTWDSTNVTGDTTRREWYIRAGIAFVTLEFTPLSGRIQNGYLIATDLPIPYNENQAVFGGNSQQVKVLNNGRLVWYFPVDTTTLRRTDLVLVYPTIS